MRILITGSSGFIGSHLAVELEAHGHTVVGVDRSPATTGRTHHVADLLEHGACERILDAERPQVVVHLAAQVGRLFGEDDWRHTISSNAIMTTFVAAATAAVNASLVYASTSEVYGDQGESVCFEDGGVALPHNLYGLSKRWGEEACALYAPRVLKILRLSMPYGTGVVPGRGRAALPNIVWQAHTRQRIPIHRGGERSWCWIGDTVRGIRLIIEDGIAGAYNVGRDDAALPMIELAKRACKLTGCPETNIALIDPPGAQTVVKRLSTDKLRSLGWAPEIELDEGMERVLEWVRRFDAEGRLAA